MSKDITKNTFANYVVDKFCKEQNLDRFDIQPEDWLKKKYIISDLKLGICLEQLELLDEEGLAYIALRDVPYGGKCINPLTGTHYTIREFLHLLPDDVIHERECVRLKAENISLNKFIALLKSKKIDEYKFNINIKFDINNIDKTITITDQQ